MANLTKHTIAELTALAKTRLRRMQYRQGLLAGFRARAGDGGARDVLPFYEVAYLAWRLGYTTMAVPSSVYDYDVRTRELTLLKRAPVLGGYDPARLRHMEH